MSHTGYKERSLIVTFARRWTVPKWYHLMALRLFSCTPSPFQLYWIFPGQTSSAEATARLACGFQALSNSRVKAVHGQIYQTVRTYALSYLIYGQLIGDQLFFSRNINAHVTWILDRRRGDTDVDLYGKRQRGERLVTSMYSCKQNGSTDPNLGLQIQVLVNSMNGGCVPSYVCSSAFHPWQIKLPSTMSNLLITMFACLKMAKQASQRSPHLCSFSTPPPLAKSLQVDIFFGLHRKYHTELHTKRVDLKDLKNNRSLNGKWLSEKYILQETSVACSLACLAMCYL